jgi:hypothetical protein
MHFRATGPRSIPIKRKYIVLSGGSEELEKEVELLKKFKVLRRTKRA